MSSSDSRLKSMVVDENRYQWTYITYPFFVCELLVKRILLQKKFGGKVVSYRNYN